MFKAIRNNYGGLSGYTIALISFLLLLSINFASAQVLRKGVTDTEADPVIPEPVEGKVHGEDYHHHYEPVKMSDGVKPAEYDASAFKPDPSYEDKPYDVEEQLKIYGGKYKIEDGAAHYSRGDVPRPVIEWGYPMYQEGPIGAGFDVWGSKNLFRPQLLVFGDWRFGLVHNDNGALDTSQIATRLNLNVDLRLTATERIHVFLRPFDRVEQGKSLRHEFGGSVQNRRKEKNETILDVTPEAFFFEGELGAIVSGLTDTHTSFDIPLSFGFMPLFFQNGIWMEDAFMGGAVSLTAQNSSFFDITNYDITLFGGFDRVTSKAIIENNGSFDDHRANLIGLAAFFDIDQAYVEAGWAYTHDGGPRSNGDFSYHNMTLAITKRYFGKISNSMRAFWSVGQDPGNGLGKTADGYLFLLENSLITSKPSTLVPYLNLFYGKNRPQSLARDFGAGGILKNTGINFETDGMTGFPKLDDTALDSAGGAIGVSYLFNLNQQLVVELAGLTPLGDDVMRGRTARGDQIALGVRYQRPLSKSWIFRTDGMVGFREGQSDINGIRAEMRIKF